MRGLDEKLMLGRKLPELVAVESCFGMIDLNNRSRKLVHFEFKKHKA